MQLVIVPMPSQSSDMNMQLAHSTKTMSTASHETTMQPSVSMPLCQPVFLPVINSSGNGTVNFTVSICPSGNVCIGETKNEFDPKFYDHLLKGL